MKIEVMIYIEDGWLLTNLVYYEETVAVNHKPEIWQEPSLN